MVDQIHYFKKRTQSDRDNWNAGVRKEKKPIRKRIQIIRCQTHIWCSRKNCCYTFVTLSQDVTVYSEYCKNESVFIPYVETQLLKVVAVHVVLYLWLYCMIFESARELRTTHSSCLSLALEIELFSWPRF